MPVCSKIADPDDLYVAPPEAQAEFLKEAFNVSIETEAQGGHSHTEERHGPREHVDPKFLPESRLQRERSIPAATNFLSREALAESRYKWLASFVPEMRKVPDPEDGASFQRTLDIREAVGEGLDRSGQRSDQITHVTFTFEWDAAKQMWCEVRGFPVMQPPEVDASWFGKA